MRHGLFGGNAKGELRGRARLERMLHDASLLGFLMEITCGDVFDGNVVKADDGFAAFDALRELLGDLGERKRHIAEGERDAKDAVGLVLPARTGSRR